MNTQNPLSTVRLLVFSQALFVCGSAIGLTLTGLVGAMLAPSRALATLPYALVTLATAFSTIPVSLLMLRWGRRRVFMMGSVAGALGGALAAWAIVRNDFLLFCLANMGLGLFAASAQYYRFAANEAAPAEHKARAIAWVISGGVLAALIGPTLAAWAREAVPRHSFAGSYLVLAGLALLSALVLSRLGLALARPATPTGPQAATESDKTPLRQLLRRPVFITAAGHSALAAGLMMFVMTSTPLAVLGCGLGVEQAASVIQWHLLAMFAPGFFSGRLIARWGVLRVLWLGAALFGAGSLLALSGLSLPHFGLALMLNGAAWHCMFVGASTLLTQGLAADSPADRARAQAANEFITASVAASCALLAGWVFERYGWATVQAAIWPGLLTAAALAAWFSGRAGSTKPQPQSTACR
ncbi:MFS transporter [Paucibacter sp. Y2R2-4]|uniref:MFS transporter n=1 Tax=Paucibacter sp. Y2R2-4 TaxID=2893553 RepID=UPI0021E3CE28|nr:MFS transporter [Paucibacter sp. Y2R2-4]MCV2351565.1 MFS transporter [Paucibacter sp. Y2R2-4]